MNKFSFDNRSFLIVDDENISRVSILRMLKKMGDPQTYSATNGVEALPILNQTYVDCAILDFNMPLMHGLQLLYKIRTGEATEKRLTPVVMLTAHGDAQLVKIAMNLDVNAFLLKPATVDSLGAKIQHVLPFNDPLNAKWLKPVEEYKAMDYAEQPIEVMLKTNFVLKKEMKDSLSSEHSDDSMKQMKVNDLVEHSILAKPCTGPNDNILFNTGTVLTQQLIHRMQELTEMGVIEPEIWVRK